MKRLTCEMCGSTDLIKENGVFVCQNCGCKYSVEEARKMMIEGTVEVTGTVKVDNTDAIDNYLSMAKNAQSSGNYTEAENYANKIIEMDPENSKAWYIKGEASGWESKTVNNRIGEAVTAWKNAMRFAAEEDKPEMITNISDTFSSMYLAMIKLYCESFERIHSEENLNRLLKNVDYGIEWMAELSMQSNVVFNRAFVYEKLSHMLNEASITAFGSAQKDFGTEHRSMSTYSWERYYTSCDNCVTLLQKAADFTKNKDQRKTIYNNIVFIAEKAANSKSWKYNYNTFYPDHYEPDRVFTSKEVSRRKVFIDKIKEVNTPAKLNAFENAVRKVNELSEEEKKEGIDAYWKQHPEEKERLENEIIENEKKLKELNQQKEKLPSQEKYEEASSEVRRNKREIELLQKKLLSLGLFKGKEKKEIQEKINNYDSLRKEFEAKAAELEKQKDEDLKKIDLEISNCNMIINLNKAEFEKERGRVEKSNNYLYENAVSDGKFNITVNELYEHLKRVISSPLGLTALEPMKSGEIPVGEKAWQTTIVNIMEKDKDGNNTSMGVTYYFVADNVDSPLQFAVINYSRIGNKYDIGFTTDGKDAENIGRYGAYLLASISSTLSFNRAKTVLASVMVSDKYSGYVGDGLSLEYVNALTHSTAILGVEVFRECVVVNTDKYEKKK